MVNATSAKFDINAGDGNLLIDGQTGGMPVLASGELQYLENQDLPIHSVSTNNGRTIFTLKAGGKGQPWIRLPWAACNGATQWQVHTNPNVPSAVTAHTDGGNLRLDFTGAAVSSLTADTGGGNIEVFLPDNAASLNVVVKSGAGNVIVEVGSGIIGSSTIDASSGAGNVEVHLPGGIAARIQATTGMGKILMGPRFNKINDKTYQSPDFDSAVDRIEITIKSGMGNAIVRERDAQPELVAKGVG